MNLKIAVIFCFCLFAAELNCQVITNDSSVSTQKTQDKHTYSNQDSSVILKPALNDRFNGSNILIPDELFLLKLNSPIGGTIRYSDETHSAILPLTLSMEYQLSGSQKELASYLNSAYMLSKPTKLQQILGVVNVSGAFLLAGYHIWKYYIKKDK